MDILELKEEAKEINRFKNFIIENEKIDDVCSFFNEGKNYKFDFFKSKNIIEEENLSLFGFEIFQFWSQSCKLKDDSIESFLKFAKLSNIPVIDHDKNDLLSFGASLFYIWLHALKF